MVCERKELEGKEVWRGRVLTNVGVFESSHIIRSIPTHEGVIAKGLVGCHYYLLRRWVAGE